MKSNIGNIDKVAPIRVCIAYLNKKIIRFLTYRAFNKYKLIFL